MLCCHCVTGFFELLRDALFDARVGAHPNLNAAVTSMDGLMPR
jgi:hypothetical protein